MNKKIRGIKEIEVKVEKIKLHYDRRKRKRAPSTLKVVTFRVEEELLEKIKDKSKEQGINLSELVRRAVIKFLESKNSSG